MPTNFTNQEVVMSELNVFAFTSLAVFKRCMRTVDFSEFLMCNDV